MSAIDKTKVNNLVLNPASNRYVKVGGKVHRKMIAEQEKQSNPSIPLAESIQKKNQPAPKKRPDAPVPKMKVPRNAPQRPSEDAPQRQGQTKLVKDGTTFVNSPNQNFLQFGT